LYRLGERVRGCRKGDPPVVVIRGRQIVILGDLLGVPDPGVDQMGRSDGFVFGDIDRIEISFPIPLPNGRVEVCVP